MRDLADDENDRAIAAAVISLGQKLGLRVIAEGVETDEQLAFLRDNDCDEMQGYLFSEPVPASASRRCWRPRPPCPDFAALPWRSDRPSDRSDVEAPRAGLARTAAVADADDDERQDRHDVGDDLQQLRRRAGHLRQAHGERRRDAEEQRDRRGAPGRPLAKKMAASAIRPRSSVICLANSET